jgi:zinc transport system substrate-binding protein
MIDTICEQLVNIDPENKEYYELNAENYKKEIENLDEQIENTLKENNIDTLVFGGEFAYSYFCQRYNLKVATCYTACGEGAEPSVSRIKKIIDLVKSKNISKVFFEELSEGTIANMIAEETTARQTVFNTLHNVSNEEILNGENYISLMQKNLEKICNN